MRHRPAGRGGPGAASGKAQPRRSLCAAAAPPHARPGGPRVRRGEGAGPARSRRSTGRSRPGAGHRRSPQPGSLAGQRGPPRQRCRRQGQHRRTERDRRARPALTAGFWEPPPRRWSGLQAAAGSSKSATATEKPPRGFRDWRRLVMTYNHRASGGGAKLLGPSPNQRGGTKRSLARSRWAGPTEDNRRPSGSGGLARTRRARWAAEPGGAKSREI